MVSKLFCEIAPVRNRTATQISNKFCTCFFAWQICLLDSANIRGKKDGKQTKSKITRLAEDDENSRDPRIKKNYFIVEPNLHQLLEVSKLIDAGSLKTFINAAVPFDEAPLAYAGKVPNKRGYGKVVVTLS